MVSEKIGAVTEVVLTLCFIPFLTYFMLSWQEHARTKSVQLFRPENRSTAYVTLGHISAMMKSFIAGNFLIGLFIGICSVVIFGFLGVPYFLFHRLHQRLSQPRALFGRRRGHAPAHCRRPWRDE